MAPAADVLTPAEAGELYRVPASTVLKWITVGVRVGGKRVRLAGFKMGGCWRVPRQALDDFKAACNPDPVSAPPPNPSAEHRRRKAEQARFLATHGTG